MTRLHLADTVLDPRQALATGRCVEAVTGRVIEDFTAVLGYSHAGGSGTFRTVLARKPGGYFALHLHPRRDVPDLSLAGTVTLTLRLSQPSRPDVLVLRQVPGTDLAPVETARTVASQDVTVARIPAAPFVFTVTTPPAPVQLDGLVLLDNDPDTPADGVTATVAVTVAGGDPATSGAATAPTPPVVTDARGRFRIPAMPVAHVVTLSFDNAGQATERRLLLDYTRPVMDVAFSIPSP